MCIKFDPPKNGFHLMTPCKKKQTTQTSEAKLHRLGTIVLEHGTSTVCTVMSTTFQCHPQICSSNWKSSPNRGENEKYLKPPPRKLWDSSQAARSWKFQFQRLCCCSMPCGTHVRSMAGPVPFFHFPKQQLTITSWWFQPS